MADTEPPHMAPAKSAPIMISPASGVMEKVIGMRIAIPMAAVKPGRAPKMIPITTPKVAMRRLNGRNTFLRTARLKPNSMVVTYSLSWITSAGLRETRCAACVWKAT